MTGSMIVDPPTPINPPRIPATIPMTKRRRRVAGERGGESGATPVPIASAAPSIAAITSRSAATGAMRRHPDGRSPFIP